MSQLRVRRALVPFAALVATLAVTVVAPAEEPRLARWKVEIEGPAGCISVAELRDAVTRTLTRDPFIDDAPDGTLHVKFVQSGTWWTVVLELKTIDGKELGAREIGRDAAECRSLDAAVVLVTSMLVDAARAHEPAPIPMRAEPAAMLALRPPGLTNAKAPSDSSASPRRSATFTSGFGVMRPFGLLPSLSLAPASWLRVARDRLLAGELGVAWFSRARDDARPGGVFDGGFLALGVCPALAQSDSVRLVTCARGALAIMRGTGTAVTLSESASVLFAQLGVGARLSLHVTGPLWVAGALDGWLPLHRPSFTVRDATGRIEVFSPGVVFGAATLGLEVHVN